MRILVAPDKFKGTLTSSGAALAMTHGVRNARPDAWVSSAPLADGGSGTLSVLSDALEGSKRFVDTVDPWGARCRVPIAVLDGGVALLETAWPVTGDALRADSEGVGRSLRAAAEIVGPGGTVLVAVGGTVSTDGGVGLATALGWRFFNERNEPLRPGGGALEDLRYIDPPSDPLQVNVIGLCDVDVGLDRTAGMFAPQKGASEEEVGRLQRGLENLADIVRGTTDIDLGRVAFGGSGGGIGAGLVAFLGAELRSGFGYVAEAAHLHEMVEMADAVITGEGRFDEQSLAGKAPVGLAGMAHGLGVPCLGLFGEISVPERSVLNAGFADVLDLTRDPEGSDSAALPAEAVTVATETLIARQPF